ncbi:MAG TPA: hypothetical protein VHV77_01780, partial [Pirellulales bacterium]|nr:hypothetical protein [Pirellulales bacterium]
MNQHLFNAGDGQDGATPMSRPARALGALALIAWPGLPQVWRRGSLRALAVACLFGAFLNALVLGSFVWDEVASPRVLHVAWSVAIGFWVAAALFSAQKWPSVLEAPPPVSRQDLFPEALGQYLQGNWFGAEALCRRVLRLQDRDAEARLMLATVLRRTGRKVDALQELAVLC